MKRLKTFLAGILLLGVTGVRADALDMGLTANLPSLSTNASSQVYLNGKTAANVLLHSLRLISSIT